MKLVRFSRDMRPITAGEQRVVPDDVAARLVAEGVAAVQPSVFDNEPHNPKPARGRYLTRKR